MTVQEAVQLIERADFGPEEPQRWVDLGCGNGLFSHALAQLLPSGSSVLGMDKRRLPFHVTVVEGVKLEFQKGNFIKDSLPWSDLDGILMANSIHYVADKTGLIGKLRPYLKANGRIIIIEYDTERGNPWVPYPLSFAKSQRLFKDLGFEQVKKIGERNSIYGPRKMYACEITNATGE